MRVNQMNAPTRRKKLNNNKNHLADSESAEFDRDCKRGSLCNLYARDTPADPSFPFWASMSFGHDEPESATRGRETCTVTCTVT